MLPENTVILNLADYNRLKVAEGKKVIILEKEKEEALERNEVLRKSFKIMQTFFWEKILTKDESQKELEDEVALVNKTNFAIEKQNADLEKQIEKVECRALTAYFIAFVTFAISAITVTVFYISKFN